jgi:hypothetical protein
VKLRHVVLALALAQAGGPALAQDGASRVSLRLGGKELELSSGVRDRLAALAREILSRCGPNTLRHPHNFGPAVAATEQRYARTLEGSRLHIVFAAPFVTESHLGGTLGVSEAAIGLEDKDLFVGPGFTRHGAAVVEHLQCEYLASLELACLRELAPHLPARYRETCARLERGADGRIVMPPPDVAPSCS